MESNHLNDQEKPLPIEYQRQEEKACHQSFEALQAFPRKHREHLLSREFIGQK